MIPEIIKKHMSEFSLKMQKFISECSESRYAKQFAGNEFMISMQLESRIDRACPIGKTKFFKIPVKLPNKNRGVSVESFELEMILLDYRREEGGRRRLDPITREPFSLHDIVPDYDTRNKILEKLRELEKKNKQEGKASTPMTDYNKNLIKKIPIDGCIAEFTTTYAATYLNDRTQPKERRVEKVIGLATLETLKEMGVEQVEVIGGRSDYQEWEKYRNFSRLHGVFVNKPGCGMYLDFGIAGTDTTFFSSSAIITGRCSSITYSQASFNRNTVLVDGATKSLHQCGIVPFTKGMLDNGTKVASLLLGGAANDTSQKEKRTARLEVQSTHATTGENFQIFTNKFQAKMQEVAARYTIDLEQHLTEVEDRVCAFGKKHFPEHFQVKSSLFVRCRGRDCAPVPIASGRGPNMRSMRR